MINILHSADLHLDSPLTGFSQDVASRMRQNQLRLPGQLADLCIARKCDLVLLAGDVFDGPYTRESYLALYGALKKMEVPVMISPGNHDFVSPDSPWKRERWPDNVHLFLQPEIQAVCLPELDCRVYGAGYQSMDCPGLLENFLAEGEQRYHIGVLHADPTQTHSSYCPMTQSQIRESGLQYLALGHLHKAGSFYAGETLCAWPGCPMGRGYDETGVKGALLVTVEDRAEATFVPLGLPQFHDLTADAGSNPGRTVADLLPPAGSDDFYRITLTGYAQQNEVQRLCAGLPDYPNLTVRNQTMPVEDLWKNTDEDSLEGLYFRKLRQLTAHPELADQAKLAAELSRRILDGQEVPL